VVATFCQYEALKYVSFPVQTLGKCAKMIPVMIWGSAVNAKTYKAKDYIVALMVTTGCAMFAMTGALLQYAVEVKMTAI
jgi:solute carrier family 35 (adenosine 3'-phospho 5'-phosphosulfate transporter), member B2